MHRSTNWERVTLDQVAEPKSDSIVDGPFGSNLKMNEYSDNGARLIQLQNIGDGFWINDNQKFIPLSKFNELSRHAAYPGDIAIAKMADPVARACILPPIAEKFLVVAGCIKLTVDHSRYDPRYIVYTINHSDFRRQAEYSSNGTTRQRINLSVLKKITLWAPSLDEQCYIADTLDTIDTRIQCTEQLISKLNHQKTGLLQDLLTRGLDEHGQLRDPIAHPEKFKVSVLGRVPKEWEIANLGTIIAQDGGLIQTGPFGSQLHAHEYVSRGVPVIMPQDIQGEYINEAQIARITSDKTKSLARHRVEFNDVVFARRGDLGRCAFINTPQANWICGTGCLLVRPPKSVNGRWLAAIYRHNYSQRQILARAVGSTMVNLNTTLLTNLIIAKPSLAEQVAIVEKIDILDMSIRTEEAYYNKLKLYKKSLMQDLLSGYVSMKSGEKMLSKASLLYKEAQE